MLRIQKPELDGPGRSTRLLALWALIGLSIAGTTSGCSGGGEKKQARRAGPVELPENPEAALAVLDEQIAEYPTDHVLRIRRADLLRDLERFEEAAEEWRAILARNPTSKLRDRAWLGRAQNLDAALGPLRVIPENQPRALELAGLCYEAWKSVRSDRTRVGTMGMVLSCYRLSRFKEGIDLLVKYETRSNEDSLERCLALLFEEQRGAAPLAVVRGLDTFARSREKEVRELAVDQLTRFAADAANKEIAHTAEGLLVRLSRESTAKIDALDEWERNRSQGSQGRLALAHRQRAIRETSDALDRGRPLQAWRSLEPLLRGESVGNPELISMVNRSCVLLCSLATEKLEIGDVEAAGEAVTVIRSLPQSWLGANEKAEAGRVMHTHQVAAIRAQAEDTLVDAKKAVDERRPGDALTMLDPLLDQFPPELIPEVQMIRARALAQRDAPADALALLERYGPFSDPQVQRLHGALLASVGRGEDAEAILENLPLKFFNVEAFDALLAALEQQSKWEKLIARLNTLGGELPVRYRPIRNRAVIGAAQRMIQNLNPQGAIDILQGNLGEKEVLAGDSGPILVRALLETGQTDKALSILIDESGGLESVPASLVKMVADRASQKLDPPQRFQLLRRLPEWERDTKTSEFLATNWPRYGDYLPRPGRYEATFQIRTYGEEGEVLTDKVERSLIEWKDSYFVVDGVGDSKETWRVDGDLWIRTTFENEWWIPVRADENPPLPEVVSPDGVKAQLVEAGHSVSTKQQNFSGCLGIDVFLPNLGPDEKIRIELAPGIGEVSWKRYIGRLAVESRELIDWSPLDADQ